MYNLYKKQGSEKTHRMGVTSCCIQHCRSMGDPERQTSWCNKMHKTLLHLESGGPEGTYTAEQRCLALVHMLLLRKVTG